MRPHSQLESTVNSTHVTPIAAVEERAKTEHANDIKEGVPSVKVHSKSIKKALFWIFRHSYKEEEDGSTFQSKTEEENQVS